MSASPPALRLDSITKRFGRGERAVPALTDVTLEVAPGERLVVLGATGAGKTTLLRVIAGLETPDRGRIELDGRDAAALAPAERDVALVFQNFSLYPHLTVRENLAFPLRAPGRALAAAEIARRVDEAGELLRITRLLDRPAKNLSGGEMQRVAIGRAIVRRPRLFLLDEPLTNLDAKLRESLRLELVKLFRALSVPVVYVTHDQAEALSMADRIVVLSEGRVLQSGTPREIYLAPASPAVARQLGQPAINLIELERRGATWCARDGTPLLPIDAAAARGVADASAALLGVRPEAGRIAAEARASPLRGRVELVEECGPHRVVAVHALGQTLRFAVGNDRSFSPGDAVAIELPPERLLLWPADSSAR
ncbi:MAG: ABC transporter ATP-binding protein [Planctomycetes bacterium]|nr:ABC transporter ATP-binding protein [Planctomycetota bacterium]